MTWLRKLPLKQTIDRVCIATTNIIIKAGHFFSKSRPDESEKTSENLGLTPDWDAFLYLVVEQLFGFQTREFQQGTFKGGQRK